MIYYIRDEEGNLVGLRRISRDNDTYSNEMYYYIKNMQEDIIGIMDSNFNKLVDYEYDSWGKLITIKDQDGNIITDTSHIGYINPYRYRSYYYDNETGFYYLNSRYYNSKWGRFINADSYGGEIGGNPLKHNLYSYGINNPTMNCDNDGTFAIAMSALIKGAIAAIGAVATYYATKKAAEVVVPMVADVLRRPYYDTPKLEYKIKDKIRKQTKVKPIVPYSPKMEEEKKPCTTASLVAGDVSRGNRLTVMESQNYVRFGGNVMCDNQSSALLVAVVFPGFILDTPHGGEGYYPHYHPDRDSHRHIWFYPTP